jgi:hypothetical protein
MSAFLGFKGHATLAKERLVPLQSQQLAIAPSTNHHHHHHHPPTHHSEPLQPRMTSSSDDYGLKAGEVSTGTSIFAVTFKGGVVMGADSRTTMGKKRKKKKSTFFFFLS